MKKVNWPEKEREREGERERRVEEINSSDQVVEHQILTQKN